MNGVALADKIIRDIHYSARSHQRRSEHAPIRFRREELKFEKTD